MRFLLVSDLHYTLPQLDWVHAVAAEFDVVVIAGDHLDISSVVSVNAQVIVILKHLQRLSQRARLVVCSGNHDLTARDAAGEKVARWIAQARRHGAHADGDSLEVDGALITICPWWDGARGREAVGEQLGRDAARPKGQWIWIYHAPPDCSPVSWAGTRYFGDGALRAWIEQHRPDMVLCGHIHQSPFRSGGSWVDRLGTTWVFNGGRQIGPVPTHVVLDTSARTASWYSLAGNQQVHLDAPTAQPAPIAAQ